MKQLLMGNEAIALGAIRSGLAIATGYPGTPSTEILETIVRDIRKREDKRRTACNGGDSGELCSEPLPLHVEWSVNEKTALEVAAGASMCGARALVTMKQVGLNVASDPLMSLNYIGIDGGLVVVVADDPGPVSSQTEQDTRHFGRYAKIAVFDPSSPEDAYTMIADAFDYSEKYKRPVIFRPTTRICHSYASVEMLAPLPPRSTLTGFSKAGGRWVIFPSLAYRNHIQIEKDLISMADDFSRYPKNQLEIFPGRAATALSSGGSVCRKGIAAGGISHAYVKEVLEGLFFDDSVEIPPYKLLKVSAFPFPAKLGMEFLDGIEEVLVVEELDPVIERELVCLCGLYHLKVKILGKASGTMPHAGENSISALAEKLRFFLGIAVFVDPKAPIDALNIPRGKDLDTELPARPPVLCAGCPHRGSFFAVKEAVAEAGKGRKAVFSGDIGCYTLGNALPLDMVDTCLCMGAGITIAQGINRIESVLRPEGSLNFAFIGDSTFFHTGIPGIVNAVYNNADIIVVVLDNFTTAMTGNQPHPGIGKNALGHPAAKIRIPDLLAAIGVQEIIRANPFKLSEAKQAVSHILDKRGVRAIIFEGPCIAVSVGEKKCEVIAERCSGCGVCIKKLGCPALSMAQNGGAERKKQRAFIDRALCTGCGICGEVCVLGAIGQVRL
ncbi:MAG: indolepyruvate ferredoxin oxidoreductase subunit alpha [Treponema sp.]|jgi:indolepyruvate ferredoxin oxidoreductase alpha subunit|nr:indolepyruvate ferredoxin oxidoreductase subunit alpha [Treponema sp.]